MKRGERLVLIVRERGSARILGTVQVLLKQVEDQQRRADVVQTPVHPEARRRGIGAQLLNFAGEAARRAGKSLLVLDTPTGGDAERLDERRGWVRMEVIPDDARWLGGRPCSTTVFYKRL